MSRPSFFQYLAIWTGGTRRSSAAPRPGSSSARPSVRFTPDQLDRLATSHARASPTIPFGAILVLARRRRRHGRPPGPVPAHGRPRDRRDHQEPQRSMGFPLRTSLTRYRRLSEAAAILAVELEADLAAVQLEPGLEAIAGLGPEPAEQGGPPLPSSAGRAVPIAFPAIVFQMANLQPCFQPLHPNAFSRSTTPEFAERADAERTAPKPSPTSRRSGLASRGFPLGAVRDFGPASPSPGVVDGSALSSLDGYAPRRPARRPAASRRLRPETSGLAVGTGSPRCRPSP